MNFKEFIDGNAFDAHVFFGVHWEDGATVFRVYAPQAGRVTLEGDFSGWQEWDAVSAENGVWTFRIYNARLGQNYKYCIYSKRGVRQEHADPYGRGMGFYGCSVIRDTDSYRFSDDAWMAQRSLNFDKPMVIYELHLGSWLRDAGQYATYDGIANRLIGYLKAHHYTHVEFLPLNEHPIDSSWGYQATGFFSPTHRFGEPWQLMNLIDRLHQAGIGAILDFVTVHFAVDRYGLRTFDGSALYESSKTSNRRSDWGSFFFEHTRGEVRSFLKSAANYWLETYHFDGLRFDAVSRLIYGHGEPECGENPGGIAFLREINAGLQRLHPTAMRIAEDSTLYPGVTRKVEDGGLGFHYKWCMGWSFDTLNYFFLPPEKRMESAWRLTTTMGYFDWERFLLPISHDVMNGSGKPLLSRIPGAEADKLRQAKLLYLYQAAHPGKKLLFLGSELGAQVGWSATREVNHAILYDRQYTGFRTFCADLNWMMQNVPALFAADYQNWTAQWLCGGEKGIFALLRHSEDSHVLLVMNTSAEEREEWFPLDGAKAISPMLHSQWVRYGGRTAQSESGLRLENGWARANLPRFSGVLVEVRY